MQVFFVMAGITSVPSTLIFRKYIYQKSKRLLIPYVFYGIVLLLLGAILPTHIELSKGFLGILYGRYSIFPPSIDNNIPLLQACGYLSPLWFLPCIFLSYMLMAWHDLSKRSYLIVLWALCVGVATPLLPILLPWSLEMAFAGFLLMLCGRGMRRLLLDTPALLGKPFPLLLLWLGSAVVYMTAWKLDGPVNMSLSIMGAENMLFPFRIIFFGLLGLSEALFLSLLFRTLKGTMVTRVFAYVGRHALRLLCIHLFIGECVYFLLPDRLPQPISFTCALTVIFLTDFLLEHFFSLITKSISRQKTTSDVPTEKH